MKLIFYLLAFVVAISALPAPHRGDHGGGNGPNNAAATTAIAAPAPAGATPAAQQANTGDDNQGANGGGNRGGNRGQNQGGGNRGQRPGQTKTQVAAAPTNTANSGQNANNGQNANGGQNANNGQTGNNGQNANSGKTGNQGSINPNLVPDFGQTAGLQPDGTGNCKADSGKTIPCQCPPTRDAFIAKLNQFVTAGSFPGGGAAPFPTGNSKQEALARISTIISTLQNLTGKPGVGCPAVSAPNFGVVQKQIQQGA